MRAACAQTAGEGAPWKPAKRTEFFGARANPVKALLCAIKGGRDEISGEQVAPPTPPITSEVLDYE